MDSLGTQNHTFQLFMSPAKGIRRKHQACMQLARSLRPLELGGLGAARTAAGHATTSGLVNLVEDYKIIEDGRMSKPEECEDSPFEVDSDDDDDTDTEWLS